MSDHKIVKVKIATTIDKGRGIWQFNNTYLKDEVYCSQIIDIAENTTFENAHFEDRRSFWDLKKQLFANCSQNYAVSSVRTSRKDYYENKKEFENLENIHQQKLNPLIIERIEHLKNKIDLYDINRN